MLEVHIAIQGIRIGRQLYDFSIPRKIPVREILVYHHSLRVIGFASFSGYAHVLDSVFCTFLPIPSINRLNPCPVFTATQASQLTRPLTASIHLSDHPLL